MISGDIEALLQKMEAFSSWKKTSGMSTYRTAKSVRQEICPIKVTETRKDAEGDLSKLMQQKNEFKN